MPSKTPSPMYLNIVREHLSASLTRARQDEILHLAKFPDQKHPDHDSDV